MSESEDFMRNTGCSYVVEDDVALHNRNKRGFFSIGMWHPKILHNIGTLWRSAGLMGASYIFTVGRRYASQASDTTKTRKHIPLWHFTTPDEFYDFLPWDVQVVAIELTDDAELLEDFKHPERACYILGAEDSGIPKLILDRAQHRVIIPTFQSLNVAVTGSIVMYDRLMKIER